MTLAERIAYHRKVKGLTQHQLAAKCGVHYSAVGHWERKNGCRPSNVEAVVAAIGITMVEFYSEPDANEQSA